MALGDCVFSFLSGGYTLVPDASQCTRAPSLVTFRSLAKLVRPALLGVLAHPLSFPGLTPLPGISQVIGAPPQCHWGGPAHCLLPLVATVLGRSVCLVSLLGSQWWLATPEVRPTGSSAVVVRLPVAGVWLGTSEAGVTHVTSRVCAGWLLRLNEVRLVGLFCSVAMGYPTTRLVSVVSMVGITRKAVRPLAPVTFQDGKRKGVRLFALVIVW